MNSWKPVLVAIAVTCSACSTYKPVPMGAIPKPTFPVAGDVQRTHYAVNQMVASEGFTYKNEGPQVERVQTIFNRLAKTLAGPRAPWPVYVVEASEKINAYAVNGTSVVMYTGLLDKLKSDDEVATILGHELAHIAACHKDDESAGAKRTWLNVGARLLGSAAAVGAALGGVNAGNLIGRVTANTVNTVGEGALIKSYDRAQEYEADQVGLMIMAKAGYDPSAGVKLWKRADEIFTGSRGLSFLSTHPAPSDRAAALEKALPTARVYFKKARGVQVAKK